MYYVLYFAHVLVHNRAHVCQNTGGIQYLEHQYPLVVEVEGGGVVVFLIFRKVKANQMKIAETCPYKRTLARLSNVLLPSLREQLGVLSCDDVFPRSLLYPRPPPSRMEWNEPSEAFVCSNDVQGMNSDADYTSGKGYPPTLFTVDEILRHQKDIIIIGSNNNSSSSSSSCNAYASLLYRRSHTATLISNKDLQLMNMSAEC